MSFVEHQCEPIGLRVEGVVAEPESTAYRACRLVIDGRTALFRMAKQTPKKAGHFVTLWKRPDPDGEIAPFGVDDGIAIVVVAVEHREKLGWFIFDSKTLESKGILTSGSKEGKRAFRVYGPTTSPTSTAAKRTQAWQVPFFVDGDTSPARLLSCLSPS